jgi:hypothetical protein
VQSGLCSASWQPPLLVPVLESKYPFDVQFVFPIAMISASHSRLIVVVIRSYSVRIDLVLSRPVPRLPI